MQLHSLKRTHANKKATQVGRGGTRGKTSGRGTKGQNARSGHKKRPELRDIIKKLPKLRGYSFKGFREQPVAVALRSLERHFSSGAVVSVVSLIDKGMVKPLPGKKMSVKLIGNSIAFKLNVLGCSVSAGAKKAIEAAGGSIK